MGKIKEVMEAIQEVERQITIQVKKGTNRDKSKIKKLRNEHDSLTASLATLHEDDRETPKDKKDVSGQEHRDNTTKKQEDKQKEFDKKQAEILVIANKKQS